MTSLITSRQPSLIEFGFYSITKQENIASKIKNAYESYSDTSIGIPYRTDGEGKGAYYDHYTTQRITQTNTQILKTADTCTNQLKYIQKQTTHNLPFSISENETPHKIESNFGLLYIPGISRKSFESAEKDARYTFQAKLIKEALLIGRPILAVCGGCWQLWEALGGAIVKVKDHNYRGGMPRIKDTTGKVGNNKQLHRIRFATSSHLLRGAMQAEETLTPPVNSVHWMAPYDNGLVKNVEVSAWSLADENLAPKTTFQDVTRKLDPEECIEAFESSYGAPILGIQWHPEAYARTGKREENSDMQINIMTYMNQAGKTFQLKQQMIAELNSLFSKNKNKLSAMKKLQLRRTKISNKFLLVKTIRETGKAKRKREVVYHHLFETQAKTLPLAPPKKQKRLRVLKLHTSS